MSLHVAGGSLDDLLGRDWLTVNHLGGYASSTPICLNTRKYHGLLVAAMTPPVRRMVLLSRVEETVLTEGRSCSLAASEYPDSIHPRGFERLVAFDHQPFPRWAYQGDGWTIQKELHLLPNRNTVCLSYTLLGGKAPVQLELRPMLALRGIHELMYQWNGRLEALTDSPGHHRVAATTRTPEVFFAQDGAFEVQPLWYLNTIYRRERERGYAGLEDLWTPGVVRWSLLPGRSVHFVCSADPIDLQRIIAEVDRSAATHVATIAEPLPPFLASDPAAAGLARSAAQFQPTPTSDKGTRRATVITRYPWSSPSGRDALIALPGLFLVTRRFDEAKQVLESMAAELRDGLLPSEYPEDGSAPLYHGADVSLWFVNAFHLYLKYTREDPAAHPRLLDAVGKIIEAYRRGTGLGICTEVDGLLTTHLAGQPTTWMDAKVSDWVVTPRQGRPVELNALWYNALCIDADLLRRTGNVARAEETAMLATSVRQAFDRRFWNEHAGCCFDVLSDHGVDSAVRPNQLLALSLSNPVLSKEHHARLLGTVHDLLLTPVGLRTLSPFDPGYCARYHGDVVTRDRAYHQGSVYPWLLGAYVDATFRVRGRSPEVREQVRGMLSTLIEHLEGDGLGHLPELFDGEVPRQPGGALSCALSVAEILRVYVEGVLAVPPGPLDEPDAASRRPPVPASTDSPR